MGYKNDVKDIPLNYAQKDFIKSRLVGIRAQWEKLFLELEKNGPEKPEILKMMNILETQSTFLKKMWGLFFEDPCPFSHSGRTLPDGGVQTLQGATGPNYRVCGICEFETTCEHNGTINTSTREMFFQQTS